MNSKETSRYGYIDVLRALAAIMVLWSHAVLNFINKNEYVAKRDGWMIGDDCWVYIGTVGVIVFFAISGYVIPSSLRGSLLEGSKQFIIRRFFRLFPLYWFSMGILCLAMIFSREQLPSFREWAIWATMIPSLFGQSPIGPTWTLEIEMLFYVICLSSFLLQWINRPAFLTWAVIFFMGLFILGTVPLIFGKKDFFMSYEKRILSVQLSVMFWGALWRKWQEKEITKKLHKYIAFSFPIMWCLIFPFSGWLLGRLGHSHHNPVGMVFTYGLGTGIFFLGTTIFRINVGWLKYLGKISYSFYLLHGFCVLLLVNYSQQPTAPSWIQQPSLVVYTTISLVLTILVSAFTYHWLEMPGMSLGKRLLKFLDQEKTKLVKAIK